MEIVTMKKRRMDAYFFAQLKYKFLRYFNTDDFIKRRTNSPFEKADSDSH